jgi:hypothetical protein
VSQISFVFGDFIFQDQVVAESIPGQIANKSMILVSILKMMGKDQIRHKHPLNLLEVLLDFASDVREEPVPEILRYDSLALASLKKPCGAPPSFFCASRVGAENYPKKVHFGIFLQHSQDGATTTDFDIVTMGAKTKYVQSALFSDLQIEIEHSI